MSNQTWTPGEPLYTHPWHRDFDSHTVQPLISLRYAHPANADECGLCRGINGGDSGLVWSRLFEEVS